MTRLRPRNAPTDRLVTSHRPAVVTLDTGRAPGAVAALDVVPTHGNGDYAGLQLTLDKRPGGDRLVASFDGARLADADADADTFAERGWERVLDAALSAGR